MAPPFLEQRAHVDALELARAVDDARAAHQLLVGHGGALDDAGAIAQLAPGRLGVGALGAFDSHRRDRTVVVGGPAGAARFPRGISRRLPRESRKAFGHRATGGFPAHDQLRAAIEIDERHAAQVGRDQDVLGQEEPERDAHILLGEDVDHLLRDTECRGERLAREQRRADVHRNDHFRAHFARHLHREVANQAAVAEEPALDLRGCKRAGHRHRRAHRHREGHVGEHRLLAGDEVGRHRAKQDRQVVQRARIARRARNPAQKLLEVLRA